MWRRDQCCQSMVLAYHGKVVLSDGTFCDDVLSKDVLSDDRVAINVGDLGRSRYPSGASSEPLTGLSEPAALSPVHLVSKWY